LPIRALCPRAMRHPLGFEAPSSREANDSGFALARALLREPEILILDGPTNAVDNATETEILRTRRMLAGRVTTIIIAHRLSSTREADRIVVMHEGRIVEEGRRTELLERRGAFSKLLEVELG
jgi:ABC-type multidrug transport system fused ATPase/permease subunit